MKTRAKTYICIVSVIGVLLTVYSVYGLVGNIVNAADPGNELSYMIIMTATCVVCSCMPVVMSNRQTVDMSYVCILSTLLMKGKFEAVVMGAISVLLVISKQVIKERDGSVVQIRYSHIFNTPPEQTFFNMGNLAISIFFPGWLFEIIYANWFGCAVGSMEMPQILLPTLVFLLLTLLFNYVMLVSLFVLNGSMKAGDVFAATFAEILPNLCCVAPIGLLFAYILTISNGQYLVLMFLFPLMLARYSFNLYLDSKNQYYKMVKVMIVTLEAKDEYTKGHSQRVEKYAEEICGAMKLGMSRTETIKIAALLHDIGKIGIEESILCKPGRLTPEEFRVIATHPEIGAKILSEINVPSRVVTFVKYHHKRYDGGGYPELGEKEEVPLDSYVLAVADAYDAMTSDRPYRKGFVPETAIDIIEENSGTQFHPEVAKAFIELKRAQFAAADAANQPRQA